MESKWVAKQFAEETRGVGRPGYENCQLDSQKRELLDFLWPI